MDQGRIKDLDQLTMVIHNPDESALHKRQAHRSIARIKALMRDKKLQNERERLIRATQAGDVVKSKKLVKAYVSTCSLLTVTCDIILVMQSLSVRNL